MAKNPKNSAPYVRKSSRNKEESTPQNHKPLDLDSLQFEEFSSSRVDLSNDVRSPEIRALEKWPMKDHETISLKKVKSDLDGMYESDINFWTPRIYIVLKEKPIAHGRIIDLDDMKNNSCKEEKNYIRRNINLGGAHTHGEKIHSPQSGKYHTLSYINVLCM
nr:uncharacterized protein LOC104090488 isoform X2 [Nicotiana tomentosiformis]